MTKNQIGILYAHTQQRDMDDKKFLAALQGVNLDKELSKGSTQMNHDNISAPAVKENIMFFQKPEVYATMSKEEQEELGRKMYGAHQKHIGDINSKRVSSGAHQF